MSYIIANMYWNDSRKSKLSTIATVGTYRIIALQYNVRNRRCRLPTIDDRWHGVQSDPNPIERAVKVDNSKDGRRLLVLLLLLEVDMAFAGVGVPPLVAMLSWVFGVRRSGSETRSERARNLIDY